MPENSVSWVGSERVRERLPRDRGRSLPVSPLLRVWQEVGEAMPMTPESWVCLVETDRMEEKRMKGLVSWFICQMEI